MTDINTKTSERSEATGKPNSKTARTVPGGDRREIRFIELLFFAYRDFISDPDAALIAYGFGRAHHRVMAAPGPDTPTRMPGPAPVTGMPPGLPARRTPQLRQKIAPCGLSRPQFEQRDIE